MKGLTIPDACSEAIKPFDPSGDNVGSKADSEIVKRRGKKRRGKKTGRDAAKEGEKEFQGIPDPGETQVMKLKINYIILY